MYLSYPVTLTDDGFGTVYAICADIPETMTYAGSREEAAGKMRGALEGALELYRKEGRPIPRPTRKRADFTIDIEVDDAHLAPPAPAHSFSRSAALLVRRAVAQF